MRHHSSILRTAGIVLAASLVVVACGDGDDASGESAGVTDSATLPVDVFAPELAAAMDDHHERFAELAATYVGTVPGGPERVDVEITTYAALAALVDETVAALPDAPDDDDLAADFGSMVEALEAWGDEAQRSADGLEADRAEIVDGWDDEDGPPLFNAYIDDPAAAADTFEQRCLDVAGAILDAGVDVAVDCTGEGAVPGDPEGAQQASLGNVDLLLADGSGLLALQQGPGTVWVRPADDENLQIDFLAEPVFADPDGALDSQQVGDGIPFPDDVEAWVTAIGGSVVSTGSTDIGPFPVTWWDLTITEEAAQDATGGQPAVAAIDGGDGFPIQLIDDFVVRLHRIQIDPESAFAAIVRGAAPDAELPPFIPSAEDAFEWAEATLPLIELR